MAEVLSDPDVCNSKKLEKKFMYLKDLGLLDFKRNKYILKLCNYEILLATDILMKE